MKTLAILPNNMLQLSVFDGHFWERNVFSDMDELNAFMWEKYRDFWSAS